MGENGNFGLRGGPLLEPACTHVCGILLGDLSARAPHLLKLHPDLVKRLHDHCRTEGRHQPAVTTGPRTGPVGQLASYFPAELAL